MADTTLAAGVWSASSPNQVELIANSSDDLWPVKGVLLAGQNLPRGALLGRITATGSSTGKYTLSVAAATDGSQSPVAVLVHDTDATAGDTEALVYTRGDFNSAALTFGAGHTPATAQPLLRGIYIHKTYGVAA